jgi:glycine betaine/proline transport system substrate-binding protein
MKSSSRKLLALVLALVAGILAAGCGGGGGGSSENQRLNLGVATGWDENQVIANITKQLMEEDLGYQEVKLTELELGPVFEGVGSGDLDAFQDMWLPNHQAQLDGVKNDVEQLDPWYQGTTEFGIGVPTYMTDVNSIPDLNDTDLTQILGIEPGAVISEKIPDSVIPTYGLKQDSLYSDQEEFAFVPWRPHWMNARYDFKFLDDPEDALGELNDGATISSIVNKDLPDKDPVAYAFMQNLRLTEDQVNEIENINPDDYAESVKTWLQDENNRSSLQPAIDAAKEAQGS